MAKTLAELLLGEDMEGGESFGDCIYNNLKNHFRDDYAGDPCAVLTEQLGMIISDEHDDKLYHITTGPVCTEIVQGDIPLTDEVAVIVGTNSDGSFYYDETTNDEVVIEARAHADTEGVTVSLLETNQRFRIRQNADVLSWYLDGTDAFMRWSDGQLEFQTDEVDAPTVLRIKPNGTSEISELDFYDADGIRLSLFTAADRGYIESVGGVLGINPNAAQNVTFFESAISGETPEVLIYGFRAADALRSLEIGVGVDAADTASFDGLSNYRFNGNFIIADAGYIGSVSDPDAIQIEADGDIVFSQNIFLISTNPIINLNNTTVGGVNSFIQNVFTGGLNYMRFFIGASYALGFHDNGGIGVGSYNNVTPPPEGILCGGSVGIGTSIFGTNAVDVLAMANGVAPTTSPADMFQMWSADVLGVALKAGPHWRSEENGMYAWHGGAGTINCFTYQDDIADEASFTLPAITDSAWGFVQAGNNEEYALFTVDDDGDVTLISNSANVVANADTDGKICLGTAPAQEGLVVKNRLGAQKNINLIIWYS